MRTLIAVLAFLLPALAFTKGPVVGASAPEVVATTLDGSRFDLSAEHGKVVVVHFWATWCEPCRIEMPALDAFYRAHRDEGLDVIAITLDTHDDLPKVKAVMAPFAFAAALLEDTQARAYGRIWRVPLTFVIDRHGVLRRDGFKASPTLDAAALDRELPPLLREPAEPIKTPR
ncbi:MAG: TlpA family protein disulfide reductase [Proteobacteria bacterium]|nr:TlpA family protein disulfide reductase [Pseudomonadota bacterium]